LTAFLSPHKIYHKKQKRLAADLKERGETTRTHFILIKMVMFLAGIANHTSAQVVRNLAYVQAAFVVGSANVEGMGALATPFDSVVRDRVAFTDEHPVHRRALALREAYVRKKKRGIY
jgi:hypothetical protein